MSGNEALNQELKDRQLLVQSPILKLREIIQGKINQDFTLLPIMKGTLTSLPSDIYIIGAGGTGGWFAPKIIKTLNDAKTKGFITDTNLIFVDGDEVEEKNLIRQNFIKQDIGKNKAEVIATRYAKLANKGINVGFIDKYIIDDTWEVPEGAEDKFAHISSIKGKDFSSSDDKSDNPRTRSRLIINLIDNGRTRKMIHYEMSSFPMKTSAFASIHNTADNYKNIVIDVANAEYNGQLNTSIYEASPANFINYPSLFYNEMSDHFDDDEDISIYNCADADANAVDQLFSANDMAATVLSNYINAWIETGTISHGRIDFTTGLNQTITSSVPMYPTSLITSGVYNYNPLKQGVSQNDTISYAIDKAVEESFPNAYQAKSWKEELDIVATEKDLQTCFYKFINKFEKTAMEEFKSNSEESKKMTKVYIEAFTDLFTENQENFRNLIIFLKTEVISNIRCRNADFSKTKVDSGRNHYSRYKKAIAASR